MKSYSYYKVEKMNDYIDEAQQQLMGIQDKKYNPTKIKKSKSVFGEYQVYDIEYDKEVNQEGYFYIKEQEIPYHFDHFYQNKKFDCLLDKKKSIALFECSYKVSDQMLKSINALESKKKKNPSVQMNKINIDLKKIVKNVHTITGAWFGKLGQKNLSSANSSGLNVDQSQLFKTLIKQGSLSSLTIVINYKGQNYTCIISSKGSFTIMNSIDDTHTRIQIIDKIRQILGF